MSKKSTLAEFGTLLKGFPGDKAQKASILENAAQIPEKELLDMTTRMKRTLKSLRSAVRKMNEAMDRLDAQKKRTQGRS